MDASARRWLVAVVVLLAAYVALILLGVSTAQSQSITATPSSCVTGTTCRPTLTWSGFPCMQPIASAVPSTGSWSGPKAASGSQLLSNTTAPSRVYTLTCPAVGLANGTASLSCTPPTQNTDGSPLTNLQAYKFYWGQAQGSYPNSGQRDANTCAYLVDQLADGTWYFVATAISTTAESAFSSVATKTITGNGTIPAVSRSVTVTVGPAEPQPPAPAVDVQTGGTFTTVLVERRYFVGDAVPLSAPVVAGATRYEWEIEHTENRIVDARSSSTPATTWTPARAGHYVARVRPCNAAGCAAWLSTTDRGYLVHAWLRAPSF